MELEAMRMIGSIEGKEQAEHFVAFLLTKTISAHVENSDSDSNSWDIWIRDEDRLQDAKIEFLKFLAHPDDRQYLDAVHTAQSILKEQRQKKVEAAKNIRVIRSQGMGMGGVPPLTLTLVILSVLISLVTDFMHPNQQLGGRVLDELSFVSRGANLETGDSPLANIQRGEVWRLVTPIFLHGSMFPHLLFNMLLLVQLGRLVEWREKGLRYLFLVLLIAAFSNALQGCMPPQWFGSPFFGGMSGVVYGLFGFIWIRSMLRPDQYPQLSPIFVIIMLVWLAAGFVGALGDFRPANLAHLGGLLSGMFLAWIQGSLSWANSKRR